MTFNSNIFCVLFLVLCTFAQAQSTESTGENNKVLHIGDRLHYYIQEDGQDPDILFVDEQGKINVPLVGSLDAQGKTLEELITIIKASLEKEYYKKATVILEDYSDDQNARGKVFMMGQVNNQGPINIPKNELLTLTKAILSVGGVSLIGDPTTITVIRDDPQNPGQKLKNIVNIHDILEKGDFSKDITLQDNDVVFVSEKGDLNGKVFVVGEVKSPGYYGIPPGKDLTVSQAILAAGGFTEFSKQSQVKLVKADASLPEKEKNIIINAEKIFKAGDRSQDYKLSNNDMLIITEKWINF